MKYFPSFKALRCLEAAVRTGSLSSASREMNITPGAVSRQIDALEMHLGIKVMARTPKGITASREGAALAKRLGTAFEDIASALDAVTAHSSDNVVTLNVYPTLAIQWLVPRLPDFQAIAPDIDLRLRTAAAADRFDRDDVDIAVKIGPLDDARMRSDVLLTRSFTPVCSRETLLGVGMRPQPGILHEARIFYSEMQIESWDLWARHVGIEPIALQDHGVRFENSSLAYQATREGRGFAIGQPALLGNDLDAGRLVMPFQAIVESQIPYYLVYRRRDESRPAVRRLVSWMTLRAQLDPECKDVRTS